jgi:hypothetical protein
MKTIPFKPAAEQWVKGPGRDPETRTDASGCAMRGEKIADVVRVLIEREFPPQS